MVSAGTSRVIESALSAPTVSRKGLIAFTDGLIESCVAELGIPEPGERDKPDRQSDRGCRTVHSLAVP